MHVLFLIFSFSIVFLEDTMLNKFMLCFCSPFLWLYHYSEIMPHFRLSGVGTRKSRNVPSCEAGKSNFTQALFWTDVRISRCAFSRAEMLGPKQETEMIHILICSTTGLQNPGSSLCDLYLSCSLKKQNTVFSSISNWKPFQL